MIHTPGGELRTPLQRFRATPGRRFETRSGNYQGDTPQLPAEIVKRGPAGVDAAYRAATNLELPAPANHVRESPKRLGPAPSANEALAYGS